MNYRLFSPTQGGGWERSTGRGKRPLIVWLHGGGEGGLLSANYYDNEPLLRANRGALGFSTPSAQKIFDGAYVVAPQAESYWLENGPVYAPRVKAIILDLVRRYPIDASRIYLAGCSNGGYLTMEMTSLYHDLFAAAVPICGVVKNFPNPGDVVLTDAQLKSITTPSWLVCASERHDRSARRQLHPGPCPHPRVDPDRVPHGHLERHHVQRPLVVDLRGP